MSSHESFYERDVIMGASTHWGHRPGLEVVRVVSGVWNEIMRNAYASQVDAGPISPGIITRRSVSSIVPLPDKQAGPVDLGGSPHQAW